MSDSIHDEMMIEAMIDATPMSEEQRAILKHGTALIQTQRQLTELAKIVEGLKQRIERIEGFLVL